MSFPAILYTAAAIAFFIMMINRPVVEVKNTFNQQTPSAESMQVSDQSSGTAGGSQLVVDSAWDENKTDAPAESTEQTGTANSGDAPASAESTTAVQPDATQAGVTQTGADQTGEAATEAENSGAAAGQTTDVESSGNDKAKPDTSSDDDLPATQTDANAAAQQVSSTARPNYARERRLGNEIRDAILDGEVLYLHDGSRNFMSIQTDATETRGGAIILHGRGFHPDWEDTVNPLRDGLAETGWTTLSLQLPVLKKEATYNDYVPLFPEAGQRIKAGIQHLKDQGISPITVVAHSCGAHMAMQWLEENGDADIDAFVGLGMGATDYGQPMQQPLPLSKLKVPVFDAYGEEDFPAVLKMAPERWEMIKQAGNPQSEQRLLPGADHYFKGKDDEVTALVSTWLNGLKFE